MKLREALIGVAALTALSAPAYAWQYQPPPPNYITPQPPGTYEPIGPPPVQQYQPPVYVYPQPLGGYVAIQPGAQPYQPPTYMRPLPLGGYIIQR